ncbi:hypothetical protein PBI_CLOVERMINNIE_63 [Gordonia phage CloverMinnie]|nr:hypothetical protein PBI_CLOVERMINNIE_63 [Gordonia phage CloverMinnie]
MNTDMPPEEVAQKVAEMTLRLDALLSQTKALPDECAASVAGIAVVAQGVGLRSAALFAREGQAHHGPLSPMRLATAVVYAAISTDLENGWRSLSNQSVFATHCTGCGTLGYEVGLSQYRAGFMKAQQYWATWAELEPDRELTMIQLHEAERSMLASYQAELEGTS